MNRGDEEFQAPRSKLQRNSKHQVPGFQQQGRKATKVQAGLAKVLSTVGLNRYGLLDESYFAE
jgi:hypothetical protein